MIELLCPGWRCKRELSASLRRQAHPNAPFQRRQERRVFPFRVPPHHLGDGTVKSLGGTGSTGLRYFEVSLDFKRSALSNPVLSVRVHRISNDNPQPFGQDANTLRGPSNDIAVDLHIENGISLDLNAAHLPVSDRL